MTGSCSRPGCGEPAEVWLPTLFGEQRGWCGRHEPYEGDREPRPIADDINRLAVELAALRADHARHTAALLDIQSLTKGALADRGRPA